MPRLEVLRQTTRPSRVPAPIPFQTGWTGCTEVVVVVSAGWAVVVVSRTAVCAFAESDSSSMAAAPEIRKWSFILVVFLSVESRGRSNRSEMVSGQERAMAVLFDGGRHELRHPFRRYFAKFS